jgi:hypothetical protein
MQSSFDLSDAREFDARSENGIDVRLLWQASTDRVSVHVADARTGVTFVVAADGANAPDAFHHPFAYASAAARRSALVLGRLANEGGGDKTDLRSTFARCMPLLGIDAAIAAGAIGRG